jgi:alkylated DNA repair protein alkB family protein 1
MRGDAYCAGFYFIPGALSIEKQCDLIRESLIDFPQPPNRTNHNAIYGPIHNLFLAAKEGKVLAQENSLITANEPSLDSDCRDGEEWKFTTEKEASLRKCKSVSGSVLLRKLRWSTLGLQFDWSNVSYNSPFNFFQPHLDLNLNYMLILFGK